MAIRYTKKGLLGTVLFVFYVDVCRLPRGRIKGDFKCKWWIKSEEIERRAKEGWHGRTQNGTGLPKWRAHASKWRAHPTLTEKKPVLARFGVFCGSGC